MADFWERIWHHLEASAGMLVQFAVLPIAKVLVLCGLGLILTTSCVNILPAPSRRLLSKVNFQYLASYDVLQFVFISLSMLYQSEII